MQLILRIAPLVALLACSPDPATPLDPGPPLDPDVASWWPDHAPLPAASRVGFFGDSITAGFGIGLPANRYARLLVENSDGWDDWSGGDLTSRYGALDVVDVSRSGAELPDLLDRQLPAFDEAVPFGAPGPTLIYVTIGGNDMLDALVSQGLPTIGDRIEADLREFATSLLAPGRFPDGVLLHVTNIYEPTDGEGQTDACFFGLNLAAVQPVLDDVNDRTRALAQELGFAWVDLRGHFLGHGFNHANPSNPNHHADDPTLWLQDDCIHPNRRGHHEVRRLFLAATDGEPLPL